MKYFLKGFCKLNIDRLYSSEHMSSAILKHSGSFWQIFALFFPFFPTMVFSINEIIQINFISGPRRHILLPWSGILPKNLNSSLANKLIFFLLSKALNPGWIRTS